jgi:putative SOS response-associated peptidase YedK
MPLIIPDDKEEDWLNPDLGEEEIQEYLITPKDEILEAWPVSLKFNYGNPYDASTIKEVEAIDKSDF